MIITCWDATLMNSLWLLSLTAMWCARTSCQEGTAGYEIATFLCSKTNKPHTSARHPIALAELHAQDKHLGSTDRKLPATKHPRWTHTENNSNAKPPEGERIITLRELHTSSVASLFERCLLLVSSVEHSSCTALCLTSWWGALGHRSVHLNLTHLNSSWAAFWMWLTLLLLLEEGKLHRISHHFLQVQVFR